MERLVTRVKDAIAGASKKDIGRCKDVVRSKNYENISLPSDVVLLINKLDTTEEIKELVKFQLLKIYKTKSSTVRLEMGYEEFNSLVNKLIEKMKEE